MASVLDGIDDQLAAFLQAQPVFFVATAPLAADGHVNLSPKGLDAFTVLGPHQVAYLDLTGSGVETIAHLRENGRIVLMFCAFEGRPRIVRLHGRGEPVTADDPRFDRLAAHWEPRLGTRSVVVVDVERVSTSCGFGVPRMSYEGDRDDLTRWARKKGTDGLVDYWADKNARSIDGLPGVGAPVDAAWDRASS